MSGTKVGSVKRCPKCGKTKRFSQHNEQSDFYPRVRKPSGLIVMWQSWCKDCQRKRAGIRRIGKPYKKRRPAMTPEQRRARNNELHKIRMQDPEYAAARRESQRIRLADKRREAGITPRNFRNGPPKINGGHAESKYGKSETIDASLLVAYIEKMISDDQKRLKIIGLGTAPSTAWPDLARRAGVSDSAFYRMKRTGRVSLNLADKLMTAAGVPLDQIISEPS